MHMRARGFSIVEFMIAMTIGLFLIAGLVYLIAETSRSRAEIERSSRQIENGRYALERIAEDIRHAGFFSEYYSVPAAGASGFPASLTAALPCATAVGTASPPTELQAGMPLAIQAYDGGGTLPSDLTGASGANCAAAGLVAANWQPNTDILVVRRAATTRICPSDATLPNTLGLLGAARCCPTAPAAPYTSPTCGTDVITANIAQAPYINQPLIQTTANDYRLFLGSGVANFDLTKPSAHTTTTRNIAVRRYVVRIYFVAKCNVPASGTTCDGTTDDGGSPIPTLKMLELGAGPAFSMLPVAEGIEQLQFDFGIDTTGDGVADTISMCDSTTPCSAAQFGNVVTVQVNIVARNAEISPNYVDDKTYSLGLKGYTTATNDKYRRHAYSSLVRVSNVAMRRE